MGSVDRPKYQVANGTIRESRVWWPKYRAQGKIIRESSETRPPSSRGRRSPPMAGMPRNGARPLTSCLTPRSSALYQKV